MTTEEIKTMLEALPERERNEFERTLKDRSDKAIKTKLRKRIITEGTCNACFGVEGADGTHYKISVYYLPLPMERYFMIECNGYVKEIIEV